MKVLVIDDQIEIQELIAAELQAEKFQVFCMERCENIVQQLRMIQPDVVLLDQILPGKNGAQVLAEIRQSQEFRKLPVIMITGIGESAQETSALNSGADDYVTKPFMPKALVARVRAVARRVQKATQLRRETEEESRVVKGALTVDFLEHRVLIEGHEVSLTLTEFKILVELLRESGRVLTRDKLRQRALGSLNVTNRTIDVHMASLRKKLEKTGEAIQTVRGVGYRFSEATAS